tara:strand:- start:45 stop:1142 length:1098 start_codon:yes stop_codon:yes gene_type:complete
MAQLLDKDMKALLDDLKSRYGNTPVGGGGGNIPVGGGGTPVGPNIFRNFLSGQQNQLGPDEFGSYTIPASDPTYSTGQQYARSIAGGIPMSQIMAPGVSYSPEQPGGYTQQQLNAPIPPQTPQEPDDPGYARSMFGGGQDGVTIFTPPEEPILRTLEARQTPYAVEGQGFDFSNIDLEAIRQQMADSGFDFTNLFGMPAQQQELPAMIPQVPNGSDFSIENLDLPDFKNFVPQEQIPMIPQISPSIIPQIPSDNNFSIENLNLPDFSNFVPQEQIPMIPQISPSIIPQIPSDNNFSIENLNLPDFSNFVPQEPIPMIPQEQIPMIPQEPLPLINPKTYTNDFLPIQKPVTNPRFSISQLNPRGLF